jgi:hypothetical protein
LRQECIISARSHRDLVAERSMVRVSRRVFMPQFQFSKAPAGEMERIAAILAGLPSGGL